MWVPHKMDELNQATLTNRYQVCLATPLAKGCFPGGCTHWDPMWAAWRQRQTVDGCGQLTCAFVNSARTGTCGRL